MTVMCMQLDHLLHIHSLRFALNLSLLCSAYYHLSELFVCVCMFVSRPTLYILRSANNQMFLGMLKGGNNE